MNLIAKGKAPTTTMAELRNIFGFVTLLAKCVEKQVKTTGKDHHHAEIQRIDDSGPSP